MPVLQKSPCDKDQSQKRRNRSGQGLKVVEEKKRKKQQKNTSDQKNYRPHNINNRHERIKIGLNNMIKHIYSNKLKI